MSFPKTAARICSTWWFPWTSAAIISFAAFVHFERRVQGLLAEHEKVIRDSKPRSTEEVVPVHSSECAIISLDINADAPRAADDQNTLQDLTATTVSNTQITEELESETILSDTSEVVIIPQSKHVTFVPITAKQKRRSTVADIVTTALYEGSSVTINPPSNPNSSTSSPIVFPRTPHPFTNSAFPTNEILLSPIDSAVPFPWAKQPVSSQAKVGSLNKPRFNFGSMSAKSGVLPTIDEEAGPAAGVSCGSGIARSVRNGSG